MYIWQPQLQNELSLGMELSVLWIRSLWLMQRFMTVARLYLYSSDDKPQQFVSA